MTPDNGGYATAAYVLATIVYVGYALVLVRRERALARALRDAGVPGTDG